MTTTVENFNYSERLLMLALKTRRYHHAESWLSDTLYFIAKLEIDVTESKFRMQHAMKSKNSRT